MVQSRVFANFKEHKAAVSRRRQEVGARKNCTTTDYPPEGSLTPCKNQLTASLHPLKHSHLPQYSTIECHSGKALNHYHEKLLYLTK